MSRYAHVVRGLPLAECKACAAPIRFVHLESGKCVPVNPVPGDAGNVLARVLGRQLHGYVVSKANPAQPGFHRFVPHPASCEERQAKSEQPVPALFNL